MKGNADKRRNKGWKQGRKERRREGCGGSISLSCLFSEEPIVEEKQMISSRPPPLCCWIKLLRAKSLSFVLILVFVCVCLR